eukprot:gene4098-5075_t
MLGLDEDEFKLEGLYHQDVYPTFGLGDPGVGGGAVSRPRRIDGFGRFARLPQAHLIENSSLVTPANRNILFRQWARMWDLEKPVLLEKSPPNMMWMRFLQGMFPTASRFVVITRHPLAVSLAHRKWECCTGMSLTQLVEHWLVQHELMQEDIKHVPSSKRMLVMYEDFVRDPE